MKINIGLTEPQRKISADALSQLLANSYTLFLKTQNFHWNVTGVLFFSLHQFFEQQYKELAAAIDEIAEKIRASGFFAPGSYAQFSKLSIIKESLSIPTAEEMIQQLLMDHELMIEILRGMIDKVKTDESTVDLLIGRLEAHEKNAWMLRSMSVS